MSNNNFAAFHYANASNYNGVPINYVTVGNTPIPTNAVANAFQAGAMAAGGRIVAPNYSTTNNPNNVTGSIGGGGRSIPNNATSGCYSPAIGRPILALSPAYDVNKSYYQQSASTYSNVTNLTNFGKVHYTTLPTIHKKPSAHLIGLKMPKNSPTILPNKAKASNVTSSGGVNSNSSSNITIVAHSTATTTGGTTPTTTINKLPKQRQLPQPTSLNVTTKSHNNNDNSSNINNNITVANSTNSGNSNSSQLVSNLSNVDKSGSGQSTTTVNNAVTLSSNTITTPTSTSHSSVVRYTNTVAGSGGGDRSCSASGTMGLNTPWGGTRYHRRGNGGSHSSRRSKVIARPQQLHYCEVCKISCAGPQTYREHLEGQKHKKREASLKMQASAQSVAQNRGNNYHCDLCDVTCTGTDAYAAHIRGSKHQKVVKLHQKLGKPIPNEDPTKFAKLNFIPSTHNNNIIINSSIDVQTNCALGQGGTSSTATVVTSATATMTSVSVTNIKRDENKNISHANVIPENTKVESCNLTNKGEVNTSIATTKTDMNEIKPVGGEYIEEVKDKDGRTLSFNCKLCDCKFNDPNAKEMHTKGRRHRLQYKRKVQPDLIVDFKPTLRQRRAVETRAQRALMQGFTEGPHEPIGGVPSTRNVIITGGGNANEYCSYWEEQRRRTPYEEEYDYNNWMSSARGFGRLKYNQRYSNYMGNIVPPFIGMMPGAPNIRRPESSDDRHAIARHAEIYPKEQELQMIQRIVSHTERALKFVSDTLAEGKTTPIKKDEIDELNAGTSVTGPGGIVKDGRDNQMLSFQHEADLANVRILKGVMRVGFLAKGLLLQGDRSVELVVLCGEKPTVGLLKRVGYELPLKLKEICGENQIIYKVNIDIGQSAVMVKDDCVSVRITLTSPLLRNQNGNMSNTNEPMTNSNHNKTANTEDLALLPCEPCLMALAELRHAKWFQARATGLQSCVMVLRILRDLCRRSPVWLALPQWSMELFVEKVISSAGFPISPGDCLRRIMEAFASGFLISGPGLIDPCEKEPVNALQSLTMHDREKITYSAQQFLRYIAFRQIHKVLGMEQLPSLKYPSRPWRINRKRRRQSAKTNSNVVNNSNSNSNNNNNTDADDNVRSEKIPKRSATETST